MPSPGCPVVLLSWLFNPSFPHFSFASSLLSLSPSFLPFLACRVYSLFFRIILCLEVHGEETCATAMRGTIREV